MNPFWSSFFEHFRSCGRNAAWFLISLAGMFVLLVITGWAIDNGQAKSLVTTLIVLFVFGLVQFGISARRLWINRRHRLKFPKLSSDERGKARSKLVKSSQPSRLPQSAPPWIEG